MARTTSLSRHNSGCKCLKLWRLHAGAGLTFKGQHVAAPRLFKAQDFNFESLGIGGLDLQFEQIFRRAFASRVFPPSMVERLGIRHVKGVLLFGPPGTGKWTRPSCYGCCFWVRYQSMCVFGV